MGGLFVPRFHPDVKAPFDATQHDPTLSAHCEPKCAASKVRNAGNGITLEAEDICAWSFTFHARAKDRAGPLLAPTGRNGIRDLPCFAPSGPGSIHGMNTWPRFFTWKRVVLILALVVVFGLGLPVFEGLYMSSSRNRLGRTRSILKHIQLAVKSYQAEYDRWPVPTAEKIILPFFVATSPFVCRAKLRISTPVASGLSSLNCPSQQASSRGLWKDSTGEVWVMDQWSRPVYVMFDANADGRLIPPDAKAEGSGELPISVAVFSAGPDGIPGNEDDITSWRG
jgi:type II secretory pathway pseudopilin PulG